MADKEIKFTSEEMAEVSKLQETYVTLQNGFGQISVNRLRVEQQLTDIDSAEENIRANFVENQNKEREFVDSINKKYGDGNLDITTGVFTPRPTEETTKKTDKTL